MRLAPNYDVPPEVSPFVPLPLLDLCTHCREPMSPFEALSVVVGGVCHSGLCSYCAAAWQALDPHAGEVAG